MSSQAFAFCPQTQATSFLADISDFEELQCIQNLSNKEVWVNNYLKSKLIYKFCVLIIKVGAINGYDGFAWAYSYKMAILQWASGIIYFYIIITDLIGEPLDKGRFRISTLYL